MDKQYTLDRETSAKLRNAFHDTVREAAAKLTPEQRQEFHESVANALADAMEFDRQVTFSRAEQIRETELTLYHNYHRQVEVSELTTTPPPPRPLHNEIAGQAREIVDDRINARTIILDNDIRQELNDVYETLTGQAGFLDETWNASERIIELDSYLSQLQAADLQQDHDLEPDL